jgi:hypothetical protein
MPDDVDDYSQGGARPFHEELDPRVRMLFSAHGTIVRLWQTRQITSATARAMLDALDAHLRDVGVTPPAHPDGLEPMEGDPAGREE